MSKLVDEIIEVGGRRWKVRQAKSHAHALKAIEGARSSGTVSHQEVRLGVVEILADVVQINSDGTERKLYTDAY